MDGQKSPNKGAVILRGPGGLAAMAVAQLFGLLIFVIYAIILIGVPCWCIGRLVVARKRRKLIAEGGTPPRPPSHLRKTVQGIVSVFMIALWCLLVYFIIAQYAYPFFASSPLPYKASYVVENSNTGQRENGLAEVNIYPPRIANFSTSELAATCAAAAKHYADQFGYTTRLTISVCPKKYRPYGYYKVTGREYPWKQSRSLYGIQEYCQIGFCVYDPRESGQWENFQVSVNADELRESVNHLWVENEDNYQDESESQAEASLKKLISEKLNIAPERAVPQKFKLKPVPAFLIPDPEPAGPVENSPNNAPEK